MKHLFTVLLSTLCFFSNAQNHIIQDDRFGAEFNPTNNAPGGGMNYSFSIPSDTTYIGENDTFDDFRQAVSTPGSTVYVGDNVVLELDSSATDGHEVLIPAGVTIISGRNSLTGSGGMIKASNNNFHYLFRVTGDSVRITGLRIKGPALDTGTVKRIYSGIISDEFYVEIDNCEFFGWPEAAVTIGGSLLDDANGYGYVHHNYFHHNQGNGLGYSVSVDSASALIEGNVFDWGRHAIAASPSEHTHYEARYNLFLKNFRSYPVDVHGDGDDNEYTTANQAGGWTIVHHNTFYSDSLQGHLQPDYRGVHISGIPMDSAYVFNNWFIHNNKKHSISQREYDYGSDGKPLSSYSNRFYGIHSLVNIHVFQNKWGTGDWGTNLVNANNTISEDRYRTGDFNGDGHPDILRIDDTGGFHVQLHFSPGIGYQTETRWGGNGADIPLVRYKIGDFDGDGDSDIISFESNKNFYVWLSNGSSGFSSAAKWGENGEDLYENYKLGDFNGDDKTDVISFEVAEHPVQGSPFTIHRMHVWLANASGTQFEKDGNAYQPYPDWGQNGNSVDLARYKSGNFGGGTNSDIIEFHTNAKFYMWESAANGKSSIDPENPVHWGTDGADRYWLYKVGNHNNSGYDDVISYQNEKLYTWVDGNLSLWLDLNNNGGPNGRAGNVLNITEESEIHLYPNPATRRVSIVNDLTLNTQVELLDMNGRLIRSRTSQDRRIKMNLEGLKTGLYIVRITNNEIQKSVRLMVTY